jgi:hypothetical protein
VTALSLLVFLLFLVRTVIDFEANDENGEENNSKEKRMIYALRSTYNSLVIQFSQLSQKFHRVLITKSQVDNIMEQQCHIGMENSEAIISLLAWMVRN